MASSTRGVSSRSRAVPCSRRSSSPSTSSIGSCRLGDVLRVAAPELRAPSGAACARSPISSAGQSLSPASARWAASISRLVTPLIAETTTTTGLAPPPISRSRPRGAIQSASPTEVPPNFMTRRGGIRRALFSRRFSCWIAARSQRFPSSPIPHSWSSSYIPVFFLVLLLLLLGRWSPGLNPNIVSEPAAVESSIVQPEAPRRTGVRGVHAHNRVLTVVHSFGGSAAALPCPSAQLTVQLTVQ